MILLTFDIEEFDTPTEYGADLSIERQMAISVAGTTALLERLAAEGVPATFFCTARYARLAPASFASILAGPHEIASHGYSHSSFEEADLARSKAALEEMADRPVSGFRMARMAALSQAAVAAAGYRYNSSINPTWIPGRYNRLDQPRTAFRDHGIWQVPAAVTPRLRFPLFWLSFHNLPEGLYFRMCRRTWCHDGCLNLYFHPWEFADLSDPSLRLPGHIRRCTGRAALARLERLIRHLKRAGATFGRMAEWLDGLERRA